MPAGRADYYGTLPNLAARVSTMAAPGQILVEYSTAMGKDMRISREDSAAFIPLTRQLSDVEGNGEHIRLELLGCYLLKVWEAPCSSPWAVAHLSFPFILGTAARLGDWSLSVTLLCRSASAPFFQRQPGMLHVYTRQQ